ncbi:MAG: NfeD family protein [Clostridia bacterium]|nr:NfeD family protein [Clostridia bacterium]
MNPTSAMLLWGALTLVFLLVEALTPQLLSVWFAVGALAALVCAALGGPFWLQVLVWVVVSALVVLLMRPLSKRFKEAAKEHTNANRIIGRHATVVEAINPNVGAGQIRVDRAIWTARGVTEEVIPVGARVKVVAIEGVKAVVRLSRVQPEDERGKGQKAE